MVDLVVGKTVLRTGVDESGVGSSWVKDSLSLSRPGEFDVVG